MNVEELEVMRKKARNIVLIGVPLSIILGLCVGVYFNNPVFGVILFVILLIVTMVLEAGPQKKFILAFKETFVLKALNSVFSDLIYEPLKGLDKSIIRDTGMMYMGDRYSSNDYISGKYKNINVVQADVHIEEEHETTDSDGHTSTYYVTIFRGRWMIFDFNKYFKANIQVSQKGFGNSKISNWGKDLKYKKVMMEDQEFNNSFRTYAQDEHEAFYILTPSLMEKLKKIINAVSGKLLFCFVDNKLHIGLQNGKDSFEHSIFKKINEQQVINEIAYDIKIITNFVDELSLDNDLFRREV